MDLATALGLGIAPPPPADDSSHHSTTEACTLPAYLRAPEVTAQVMAEYIWLMGGTGQLRSKTKVLDAKPSCAEEAPIMIVESNPDGQLAEPNHELFLKPRKIFRDPFRGGDHILVLCDTFIVAQVVAEPGAAPSTVLQPSETNSRVACENVLRVAEQQEPVFAVEQEYAIIHPAYPTKVPLGPRRPSTSRASSCHSGSRRSSYVSSGSARGGIGKNSSHHGGKQSHAAAAAAAAAVAGIPWPSPDACEQTAQEASAARQKASRQLADSHLRCCLFAGVKVTGADVHSLDGLHSYKIGPSPGVDLGDDLWTSRYLLQRVAEQHSASVSWDPDSMPSERPLGCHFKYSTAATRQAPHGLNAIEQQLVRLQATHVQHQVAYNDGRLDRLSSPEASTFTHAVGSANASVVVPSLTFLQQGGYYTDRRPPSDADPYKVTLLLAATTLDIPLPKLPASSSAGNTAANCSGGMSAGPSSCPAAAALPFGSPMQSYLLAAAAAQRQQQQHLMFDTESEECDSVDEDDAMTEDSAALLAKMDDDGGAAEASSCDSDFEDQDDASSSPITGTWADNDCTHMLGAGI